MAHDFFYYYQAPKVLPLAERLFQNHPEHINDEKLELFGQILKSYDDDALIIKKVFNNNSIEYYFHLRSSGDWVYYSVEFRKGLFTIFRKQDDAPEIIENYLIEKLKKPTKVTVDSTSV